MISLLVCMKGLDIKRSRQPLRISREILHIFSSATPKYHRQASSDYLEIRAIFWIFSAVKSPCIQFSFWWQSAIVEAPLAMQSNLAASRYLQLLATEAAYANLSYSDATLDVHLLPVFWFCTSHAFHYNFKIVWLITVIRSVANCVSASGESLITQCLRMEHVVTQTQVPLWAS